MTLVTDLDAIHQLAAERQEDFEVMRYLLERMDSITDAELDRLVDSVAGPIAAAIDCTRCGNCCRSLNVYVTPEDAQTLAEGIDIPVHAVITRYIDLDSSRDVGEWGKIKQRPCPFLRGSLCSVYAHRPDTCRAYPMFTPDFRWTLADLIDGAGVCPIIFNVLERMVQITDELTRQSQ
jgi:hypothetical protein